MGVIFLRNKLSGAAPADAYAIGGASPELVASFLTQEDGTTEGEYFRTGGATDDFTMFTFARSGSAWYFNSSGVLTEATSGNARRNAYYHNGTSWVKGGLQKDPVANTQLLHGTDSFATQDETVTAQAYTLQFRGTGSIALTGAHTATLNGTGANDLVSLTFTPSAGTLTLTPSGTVDYPQLETGSAPTSYIPNTAASGTVTRAIETLSIAGANNPITATTATFFWDFLYTTNNTDPLAKPLEIFFSNNERMRIYDGDGANRGYIEWFNDPGLDYNDVYLGASGSFPGVNVRRRGCASIAENDELLISVNGSATGPTAVTAIADFSGQNIVIATSLTTRQFTCFVREIRVGSFKTSGADAEAVTAI